MQDSGQFTSQQIVEFKKLRDDILSEEGIGGTAIDQQELTGLFSFFNRISTDISDQGKGLSILLKDSYFFKQTTEPQGVNDGAAISNNGPFTITDKFGNAAVSHPSDRDWETAVF